MANYFEEKYGKPAVASTGNYFEEKYGAQAESKPASNDPWDAYARHMSQQQSAPEPEPENDDWQITRGFKAGIDQTQAMGGALAAVAGDALGADKLREWGLESYQKNMQEAEAHSGDTVTSWADIEGLGDLADYVMYGTGNAVAQFLPSIATGGAGSLIGRQLVKKSAMEILERELKKGATREQAAELARKKLIQGQVAGGTTAATTAGIGLSTGEIGAELYEETGDLNPGVAAGFGTVAGMLDALPVTRVLDKVGLGKEFRDRVTESIVKDVGIQALYEGGTEGLQTVVEKAAVKFVDENKDIFTAENLVEIGDAIALGAFGGTAIRTATRAADGVLGPKVGDGSGSDGDAAAELDRIRRRDIDAQAEAAAEQVKAEGGDALSAELARNEVYLRGEPMAGATFTPDQFQPIPSDPPEGTIDFQPYAPGMQQPVSIDPDTGERSIPLDSRMDDGLPYAPPQVPEQGFSLVELKQQGQPVGNEIEFTPSDLTNEKAAGIEALIAENEYRDIGLDAAPAEPVVEPEGYQPGPAAREEVDQAEMADLERLYEETRNKLPKREKGNQTAGNQDMDILQFIASEGGISTDEAKARGFDSGDTGKRAGGIARVFTKKGKSFDAMAERLGEEGFFDGRDYTPNELEDMVRRGLSGEMVFSPRSEKAAKAKAIQADLERIQGAMDELQAARDEDVTDPPKGRTWQAESDPVRQLGYTILEAEGVGVPQANIDRVLDSAQTPEQAEAALREEIELEKQFRGFWFGSEGQGESGGQGDQAAPRGPEAAEEGRGAEAAAEAVGPDPAPDGPEFGSYADAQDWIEAKSKEYGGRRKFTSSQEYAEAEPIIRALYESERDSAREKSKRTIIARNDDGTFGLAPEESPRSRISGFGPSKSEYGSLFPAAPLAFDTREEAAREAESNGLTIVDGFQLTQETEAQRAERERTEQEARDAEARQQQEAEQKVQADAERDDFTLTGSDRSADVQAAQGQEGLFEQAPPKRTLKDAQEAKAKEKAAARLKEITISETFMDDSGNQVTVEQSAEVALRQIDKRLSVLDELLGCVSG